MEQTPLWTAKILSQIHEKGRKCRRISHAERAIGVSSGYLRKRVAAGTIDLEKLLGLMEDMALHPARFFRQVFPTSGENVLTLIDPPQGPPPAIIERAWARLLEANGETVSHDYLKELDRRRYEEPKRTALALEDALDRCKASDLPFLLGVWASTQRILLNIDKATHAILTAFAIAVELGDSRSYGDLLRRLSYVIAERGENRTAFILAKEASDVYLIAGDLVAVGRTLVDRGMWHFYLSELDTAITMQERALELLPKDDHAHRLGALQGLGLYYQERGEYKKAAGYAEAARTNAVHLSPWFQAKLAWLEAGIAQGLGNLETSEHFLKHVVDTFRTLHIGQAALAIVDIVEIQLTNHRFGDAYRSATSILPLIGPLSSRNRLVAAIETELTALIRDGAKAMQILQVEHVRQAVQNLKRERRIWRSLHLA